jgi:Homeodomain-like domain
MSAVLAELPRVNGRHRNRALAASRRARAIQLRAAGRTYQQIATELGYANRGTVCRIVSDALSSQTVEAVDELRSLEVARLDKLQLALWPAAVEGDLQAVSLIIRIIMARSRLLGLQGRGLLKADPRARTVVHPSLT